MLSRAQTTSDNSFFFGWCARVGSDHVGLFVTQRHALADVYLETKGQSTTLVVSGSEPETRLAAGFSDHSIGDASDNTDARHNPRPGPYRLEVALPLRLQAVLMSACAACGKDVARRYSQCPAEVSAAMDCLRTTHGRARGS
jgi:hypothetical protein